jgi:hypothetical protein
MLSFDTVCSLSPTASTPSWHGLPEFQPTLTAFIANLDNAIR